ncbi:MAG TPA: flagellar protein FlaG [Alcaligenes phenolicus]|nr:MULTISPECIES: flagellar protein FlaG [Alcaligenes]HRO20873.1 flagellar protein FlaG [Alcaligenes phenolicus]HRP13704.1 flagellar protein FlaG [Alcaligenes phenolicus]
MTSTLDESLENLNASMEAWATGMRFDMDEDAQRLVVSIIDSNTGEVLRTVPSEAVIQVARMIVQLQGTMINTQA